MRNKIEFTLQKNILKYVSIQNYYFLMQYKYKHSIIESQCILYTLEQSFTILLDYFNLHSFQLNHITEGAYFLKVCPLFMLFFPISNGQANGRSIRPS